MEARVIISAYSNLVTKEECMTAQCVFYKDKTLFSENLGTMSHFIRRLERKHRDK